MEEVRHAVVPRLAAALRAFTVHVARRCGLLGGRDHEPNISQGLHRGTDACPSHFALDRNIVSQALLSANKRPRSESASMDDLGGAFQMEFDSGNGKTAQEAQADDEDDAAEAAFMAELKAAMDSANLAARALDKDAAATEESIGKLFKPLIVVGTKPGALSRDTLPVVVLKASQGEHCTIEYLDKPDPSLKGAAMIIVSEMGYNNCLAAREVDGVRFLSEARANVDPAFAGRLDGVMVLRVSKGPKNLNPSSKKQLEFYGNDIGDKIKASLPVVAHRLVKDGFIKANDVGMYGALQFELLNAETMCTVGRKWGVRNVKNMFVFVFKWTYQDKPIKLQFLAPILSVVSEFEVKTSTEGSGGTERTTSYLTAAGPPRVLAAKNEDYQIAFAGFCPGHAHCFCPQDCAKWSKIVKARQLNTAKMMAQAEEKKQKRLNEFGRAMASSSSDARF